jgi:signal transduction histidine kinase
MVKNKLTSIAWMTHELKTPLSALLLQLYLLSKASKKLEDSELKMQIMTYSDDALCSAQNLLKTIDSLKENQKGQDHPWLHT